MPLLFILFLIWGSFLNVIAYRAIKDINIISPRSHCLSCKKTLAWYDLIPVISWIMLRARCRSCRAPISFLYPLIEFITAISLTLLYMRVPAAFIPAYFIFFSALIISIRTDLETLLISRLFTLWLIPFGLIFSYIGALPISFSDSIFGVLFGYGFLWIIAKIFLLITGKQGMGQGDLELLAVIGGFCGLLGVWITLLLSTIIGSLIGIAYIKVARASRSIKIPFGPFLAGAAILYVLFEPYFIALLIPTSS